MNPGVVAFLLFVAPAQPAEPRPAAAEQKAPEAAPAEEPTAEPESESGPAPEPAPEAAPEPAPGAAPEPAPEPAPGAAPEPAHEAAPEPEATAPEQEGSASESPMPREPRVAVGLQVRPRAEKSFGGRIGVPRAVGDLRTRGLPNYQTTQRTRAGLGFAGYGVKAKVSLQDVRTWGSEADSLFDFSADNLDFHEAWMELGEGEYGLRVGRQEYDVDDQRLIGAYDWTQQGRSFDAARFDYRGDRRTLTLFASRVPTGTPAGALVDKHDLFTAHLVFDLAGVRASVPLVFQTNELLAEDERVNTIEKWNRFTGGVHLKAGGVLFWRAEGYAQTGTDQNAFMAAARVGYEVSAALHPAISVDYLSGDSDHTDAESGTFDTLFATNHDFYGAMDRFLAIPADTAGGGLIDVALENEGRLGPGTLEVHLHQFFLAAEDQNGNSGVIGSEVDLAYSVQVHDKLDVVLGASGFIDEGDFRDARDASGANWFHDWFFLMLDLNI
jgi:hypothetical protein